MEFAHNILDVTLHGFLVHHYFVKVHLGQWSCSAWDIDGEILPDILRSEPDILRPQPEILRCRSEPALEHSEGMTGSIALSFAWDTRSLTD